VDSCLNKLCKTLPVQRPQPLPLLFSLCSVQTSSGGFCLHIMNRHSTLHQQLEGITDLTTLSPVSDDILVSCLRERFLTDNIYTNVGPSAIVVVNPHKYVPSNADSVLYKYSADYWDTAQNRAPLPPHIFQLANNAYYHMRRTTQDQCILIGCAV
jgi:chitin synthase